jgi:hypothetical protein
MFRTRIRVTAAAGEKGDRDGGGVANAATVSYKSFHGEHINCKAGKSSVTCSNGSNTTATVGSNGKAKITGKGTKLKAGKKLKNKVTWSNGKVSCGVVPGKGMSCYANNGHGFFINTDAANKF